MKRRFDRYKYVYWIDDLNWIKEQILKTYSSTEDREMFMHIDKSNYGRLGYIFFSIEGSPPKGCAIYQPDNRCLIIIDAWGEKKKRYSNTLINKELLKND